LKSQRRLVVATTNPGKIAEIRAMLDLDVECTSLSDFPRIQKIKEDGATFAENARKKAVGYAKATGLWTLADDSGLVVDALSGAPGVNSARFSGQRSSDRRLTDIRNMEKLLKLLEGVPEQKRTARFVCCLCLASEEKVLIETEAVLEGLITERPRGENGFGYDPIFFVPGLQKTVAELSSAEKNAISHRGNAIRQLRPPLQELLQKG